MGRLGGVIRSVRQEPSLDEQLPADQPRYWLPAAAVGGRVASENASGPVGGRSERWARPVGTAEQLLRWGLGIVRPGVAAGDFALRLCQRRVFQPQAGAGELRQRGIPLRRRERAS